MPQPRAKILIIDDDIISVRLIAEALSPQYDVIVATTPEEGLQQAKTISPELLSQLAQTEGPLERKLSPGRASEQRVTLDENAFRWGLNEDPMATEKLAEGIRQFARDQEKLEALLAS